MKVGIFIVLVSLCAAASLSAQGGQVSFPEKREATLAKTTALIASGAGNRVSFPVNRANPFAAIAKESAPVVVERAPEPERSRLSDGRAVQAVARDFNPAGLMILGDRRVLRLRDGSMLREGDTFTARIEGEPYRVLVSAIDPSGYELTVGEASIRRGFTSARGASRTEPSPAETDGFSEG